MLSFWMIDRYDQCCCRGGVTQQPEMMVGHWLISLSGSWIICLHQHGTVACKNWPGHSFESLSETRRRGLADCCKPFCNRGSLEHLNLARRSFSLAVSGKFVIDTTVSCDDSHTPLPKYSLNACCVEMGLIPALLWKEIPTGEFRNKPVCFRLSMTGHKFSLATSAESVVLTHTHIYYLDLFW